MFLEGILSLTVLVVTRYGCSGTSEVAPCLSHVTDGGKMAGVRWVTLRMLVHM